MVNKNTSPLMAYTIYPGLKPEVKRKVIKAVSIAPGIGVNTDEVARLAAKAFDVSIDEMLSRSRLHVNVCARRAYIALITEFFGFTLTMTGSLVDRDHASIIHNKKKHSDWMETYTEYAEAYTNARNMCKSVNLYEPDLYKKDGDDIH